MAKKPENVFRESVHKFMKHDNPYHMKNNNDFTGGVPDDWYSGNADDLWVEYKFIVVPKRDSTQIIPDLSKLQLEWCNNRKKEGRNIIIIIGCKEGGVIMTRARDWRTGMTAEEFRGDLQTRKEIADYIRKRVSINTSNSL